jgi:hypothetical protein
MLKSAPNNPCTAVIYGDSFDLEVKVDSEAVGRKVYADICYYRDVEVATMEGATLLPVRDVM